MNKEVLYLGLDVRAENIVVAVAGTGRGRRAAPYEPAAVTFDVIHPPRRHFQLQAEAHELPKIRDVSCGDCDAGQSMTHGVMSNHTEAFCRLLSCATIPRARSCARGPDGVD